MYDTVIELYLDVNSPDPTTGAVFKLIVLVGHVLKEKSVLVVLCVNLEVALGMIADRALVRGVGADHDVSAVSALPYLYFALCEDSSSLHIL